MFSQKKQVYESIIIFSQIILFPNEAYTLNSSVNWNVMNYKDDENVNIALDFLKLSIPKLKLISNNNEVIENAEEFIKFKNKKSFNKLLEVLEKDLHNNVSINLPWLRK